MCNGTVAVHALAVVQIADAIAGGAVAPPRCLLVFSHPGQIGSSTIPPAAIPLNSVEKYKRTFATQTGNPPEWFRDLNDSNIGVRTKLM